MSHFIGLVFVNSAENDLDFMLAPYDEQTDDENYIVFEDCTEEIQDKFDNLPEKDESLDENGNPWKYPCDKEHYPTFESLAEDWFGYRKNEEGIYGYTHNPNAKWDWYAIGNRWSGYLYDKNGHEYNQLHFDDVDWEKMFKGVEETSASWTPTELGTRTVRWVGLGCPPTTKTKMSGAMRLRPMSSTSQKSRKRRERRLWCTQLISIFDYSQVRPPVRGGRISGSPGSATPISVSIFFRIFNGLFSFSLKKH